MMVIEPRDIRDFLSEPSHVKLMIDATDRGRPAVEPLQNALLKRFDWDITSDRNKKTIGREAKKVMEANGYRHLKKGVLVTGPVFTTASTYVKR